VLEFAPSAHRQPQHAVRVNQQHPLAKGLIFLFDGRARFVVGPSLGFTPGAKTAGSVAGLSLQFGGSDYAGDTLPAGLSLPLTLGAVAHVNALGTPQTLISAGSTGVDDNYFQFGVNTDGTIRATSRSGSYVAASSVQAVVPGRRFVAAAVYSSTTSRSAFLDYLWGSPNNSISSPTPNAFRLGVLARSALADYLNGGIALAAAWNRALSQEELIAWADEPWQLFEPRRIWVPVSAAAALPTLSLSTFKPGTLTSSGWTPRITAS
jgi:hypothetical protein